MKPVIPGLAASRWRARQISSEKLRANNRRTPGRVGVHCPDALPRGPETRTFPGFRHRGWTWIPFRSGPFAIVLSPPEFFDEFRPPKDWTGAFRNTSRFGAFDRVGSVRRAPPAHRSPLCRLVWTKLPKDWP